MGRAPVRGRGSACRTDRSGRVAAQGARRPAGPLRPGALEQGGVPGIGAGGAAPCAAQVISSTRCRTITPAPTAPASPARPAPGAPGAPGAGRGCVTTHALNQVTGSRCAISPAPGIAVSAPPGGHPTNGSTAMMTTSHEPRRARALLAETSPQIEYQHTQEVLDERRRSLIRIGITISTQNTLNISPLKLNVGPSKALAMGLLHQGGWYVHR